MSETRIRRKNRGLFLLLKATASSQISSWADMGVSFVLFSVVNLTLYDGFFAKAIGAATGGVINCLINYKWTFRPDDCSYRTVIVKYAMVWVGSLLLNSFGTAYLTGTVSEMPRIEQIGINIDYIFLMAQLAVAFIVSVFWNFTLQRYFVFRSVNVKGKVKKVAAKIKR